MKTIKIPGRNKHQPPQSVHEQWEQRILSDLSHILHTHYKLLPSGRRYREHQRKLNCFKIHFASTLIKILNNVAWGCRGCAIASWCSYHCLCNMCNMCNLWLWFATIGAALCICHLFIIIASMEATFELKTSFPQEQWSIPYHIVLDCNPIPGQPTVKLNNLTVNGNKLIHFTNICYHQSPVNFLAGLVRYHFSVLFQIREKCLRLWFFKCFNDHRYPVHLAYMFLLTLFTENDNGQEKPGSNM